MSRPDLDTYFLRIASAVAARSTCLRRAVGCVLVNERGRVLSTGYNGVAVGAPHCNERVVGDLVYLYPHACEGAGAEPGMNLDACAAIHAEQNALMSCPDAWAIQTCYVTTSPCVSCTKLLLSSSCTRVVFAEEYPQPAARELWTSRGREWVHHAEPLDDPR